MHRRDLPVSLDLLLGFEAAARSLSFTSAAGELHLTQSAISRQVQQLEEQLGVRLFERRTRALVLTEAGDRYYRDVSKALNQLREATVAIRAQTAPVVRVTTTLTFASQWLVPRLASFQKEHPEIAVHVVADNIVRDLERNSLDVALRYCPAEAAGPNAERLFGEQVAPVAAPALLKGLQIRGVEDLLRLPLIEFEDTSGLAPWLSWKVWSEAMGIARPHGNSGLSFSHYDQVVQAAVSGQGVALGRFPLLDPLVAERRLALPLKGRQYATLARRAYWLVTAAAAAQRPEVETFCAWMRDQVSAQIAST